MNRNWKSFTAGLVVLVMLGLALPSWVQSEDSKKEERVASVADIMVAVNKPAMTTIGSIFKEAPSSDADWAKVRSNAAMLNEIGHLLMQDGRCPDGVWAKGAGELRSASAAYVKAARDKNLEAAKEACKGVAASCKTCHTAHRKE